MGGTQQILLVLALSVATAGWAEPNANKPSASPPPKATAAPTADQQLRRLYRQHDDMRSISWYRHPSSPRVANSNAFFLYFGREDSGQYTPLRLVVRYYADSWLFVERAWAKADGVQVDVPQKAQRYSGWERDNASGSIWEWSDVPLDGPSDLEAVRRLANAKNVTVRFEGRQYYNDRKLSAQQLAALREVLSIYEAVTGSTK
jgi:hypothetical protein